jgi:hypothetical protein
MCSISAHYSVRSHLYWVRRQLGGLWNACIIWRTCGERKEGIDDEVTGRIHDPSSSGRGAGHPVLFDARELARSEGSREWVWRVAMIVT